MVAIAQPIPERETPKNSAGWILSPTDFRTENYPGPSAKYPDAARWLMHCINFQRAIRKYDLDEYVNLHSHLLAMVMGRKDYVKPVREDLIRYGLIECDGVWAKDIKSLGFRLGPKLKDSPWAKYQSADKRFSKRVQRFKEYTREPKGFKLPVHYHLSSWLDKVELPRDLPPLAFIEKPKKGNWNGPTKEELGHYQMELIWEGFLERSVCEYGRFHSNFTGLCREIRPYLKLQGEDLREIDVVNSQPYFLGILLLELFLFGHCLPNTPKSRNHLKTLYCLSSLQRGEGEGDSPYVSQSWDTDHGVTHLPRRIPEDLQAFLQDTAGGTFYERFLSQAPFTRDELKPKVFQILYGDKYVMDNSTLTKPFQALYPTVFEMTRHYKQEMGHKWVGRELQKREAELIINRLCDILRTDYPEVPILTIHDSLLTSEPNLPLVKQLLEDQFSQFPFPPKFRMKG